MIRRLRIVVCGLCVLCSVLLVALWIRSFKLAERAHGRLWNDRLFILASNQGKVTVLPFRPAFHPGFWKWEVRRYPVECPLAFPGGDIQKCASLMGFGVIRDPRYSLDQLMGPREISNPDKWVVEPREDNNRAVLVSYASSVVLHGTGVILPYWFLVLFAISLAALVYMKWPPRFSVRSMFVAVTVVAIVLALEMQLGR